MKIKQKKSRTLFGLQYNYLFDNYLLGWIANLGVVPLFLFAVFLFAPALFFFAALLLLVTHVLETILTLLSMKKKYLNIGFKLRVLPIFGQSVKVIFILMTFACHNPSKANEIESGPHLLNAEHREEYILSRGEMKTFHLQEMKNFSVSNKEVIKYRFIEKSKDLVVNAKQIGLSQIMIFNKNGGKQLIDLLVVNKSQEAKLMGLSMALNALDIKSSIEGNQLKITGEINNINNYKKIKKITFKNDTFIINNLNLNESVKKNILTEIFDFLLQNHYEFVHCFIKTTDLFCAIPDNETIPENVKNYLDENYGIRFYTTNANAKKNYLVKIKLIQLEQTNGEEIRLGLEQLNSTISEIFHAPLTSAIEKNRVILNQNHLHLSTLAEPQIVTEIRSHGELSLGADISFKNFDKERNITNTEWKFSGLKIKFYLDQFEDKIKINYETELSRPDNNDQASISGTKEKSAIYLNLNNPKKMFEITLKTNGINTEQFPYLAKIPILGEIFKSKSTSDNYKTITGIMEISENE